MNPLAFGADDQASTPPAVASAGGATSQPANGEGLLEVGSQIASSKPAPADKPADEKGPPLPFHSIEGYGGGAITPMAYLVNPGPKDTIFGLPAAAFSNVIAGSKGLQSFTISETILRRIEFSYAIERFGTGTLEDDIKNHTGVDIHNDAVYLHNWNVRANLLEENAFGLPFLPALTAGVQFKYNEDIADINHRLDGALGHIGYESPGGEDYTLTASKTIVDKTWTLGRPLILTGGLRNSDAAQLGFLGFGEQRHWTFEGSIAYMPTDWLLIAYEFRGKEDPYGEIRGLVGNEDNWNAIDVSWIINKHATLVVGYGAFGTVVNTQENDAFWIQFKYEF
jgi:hypothetical protein